MLGLAFRRAGAALAGAGLVLAVSGCADLRQWQGGTPQTDALVAAQPTDPAAGPRSALLARVPFFAQEEAQCGPAALATVLVDLGLPVTPKDLLDQVFTPAREGSFQVEMLAAARRRGALAVRVGPRLPAALREVAAGRPVVVLLNPALAFWPRWHYAVLVGYDLDAATVTLRSGGEAAAVWPLRTFEYAWSRSAFWGMVVTPATQPPATASRDDLADAVTAWARLQPAEAARPAYDAALALWPRDTALRLGLAQTWADQRAWPQAVAALEQAVADGGGAVALNNLAMVWWQAGQAERAREVAAQAVQRARTHEPRWLGVTEDTWRQVQASPP
ncbi:MAG: hypothetical protein RI907_2079 [Pseudomonadota bacterium]|jgi:hypothetical protein